MYSNARHPQINPDTGRKLSRPLGGTQAAMGGFSMQDPTFKSAVALGSWNVLIMCIDQLEVGVLLSDRATTSDDFPKVSELQDRWHLLIPPQMSLLDDHEMFYRIRGLRALRSLLNKADASLLKRTSLDSLVRSVSRLRIRRVHI